MDPALYEALEAWAAQELRSLNGQIEYVLKQALARRRKEEPPEIPRTGRSRNPRLEL